MNIPKGKKVFTIVSLIIGVIGILLAIIFYLHPLEQKSIQYSIQNYPLFKDYVQQIDGMQIFLYGNEIKNLTVSNIAIWNSGRSTIERENIPQKNPLAVKLLSEEIIEAKILYQTNIGNDVSVRLNDNTYAIIDFEYIDRNDGFVLQIIHTGNYINEDNILGEIKGLGQLKNYYNLTINGNRNIVITISFFSIFFIIVFLWVYFHTTTYHENKEKDIRAKLIISIILGIVAVIILFLVILLVFLLSKLTTTSDPFKINVPNNLIKFFISN